MRAILRILVCCQLLVVAIATQGATLAGQQVQGGGTVEIRFPVAKSFQDVAAQGGNPRPETGRVVLTFPAGFDPARNWPILIVTSTSDFNRTSPMDAEWVPSAGYGRRMGFARIGCDNQTSPRFDPMAPRAAGSGARINAQGMAAVGQMAGGIRRLFRWGEAQCGVRGDAGQDRSGHVRILS